MADERALAAGGTEDAGDDAPAPLGLWSQIAARSRELFPVQDAAVVENGILWLTCILSPEAHAIAGLLVEWLELLALLHHADPEAAAAALREHIPASRWRALGIEPPTTTASATARTSSSLSWSRIGYRVVIPEDVELTTATMRFVLPDDPAEGSRDYQRVRSQLRAGLRTSSLSSSSTPPPIPIAVVLPPAALPPRRVVQSDTARLLHLTQILELHARTGDHGSACRRLQTAWQGPEATAGVFAIRESHLRHMVVDLKPVTLALVQRMHELGIPVRDLSIRGLRRLDVPETSPMAAAALVELFGGRRRSAHAPLSLVLNVAMEPRAWEGLLSGIFTGSRAIEELALELHGEARDEANEDEFETKWHWLATALFSAGSRHQVRHWRLDCDRLVEHDLADLVWGVRNDPYHQGTSLGEFQGTCDVRPEAIVRLQYPPHDPKALSDLDLSTAVDSAQLRSLVLWRLADDTADEWTSVLLPGWGPAWVRNDDVVAREEKTPTTTVAAAASVDSGSARGVRELTLERLDVGLLDGALQLLREIGSHVRRLVIHDYKDEDLPVGWLAAAVRSCPYLEELELLTVSVESLSELTKILFTGSTQLRKITFDELKVSDMASVHAFFDALGDPKNANQVRDLTVHIFEQIIAVPERGPIIASAVKMLKSNRRIVRCFAKTYSSTRHSALQARFGETNGQYLPIQKAPFPLPSRLAFLSTIQSPKGASVGANSLLDSNVLAIIFQFAAEPESRECCLLYRHI